MRRRIDKLVVKASGLTGYPPLILSVLSADEEVGMRGVAVKCIDITQNADCEGRPLDRN